MVGGRREEKRGEPHVGGADGRVGGVTQGRRNSENEQREHFRHAVVIRHVSIRRIERKRA
jgi:hypothetical protein